MPRFHAVDQKVKVDVVVVGGGITGVTAAYLLKRAGLRIALVERGRCGGVDTSYTTAHLTRVTDMRLHQLVQHVGEDASRLVWEAGAAAIDQICANVRHEEIDCGFKWTPGFLFAAKGSEESEITALKQDAALAKEFGVPSQFLANLPQVSAPAVRFDHQAKFHPLAYLRALLKKIPGKGSFVFERTEATEFSRRPFRVKANGHWISCRHVILATHTPLTGKTPLVSAALFQSKLFLYSSYALGAKAPRHSMPEGLYWDTASPYHYLRVDTHRDFDYLIFGGEDHKTGQECDTEAIYTRLAKTLTKWIPRAKPDHRWSGQVIETADGLPFIGETAPSQFVATGFAGNGITFGTLGAMMAVDALLKRKNPWAELFCPKRKHLRGGWRYVRENLDYPYYLVRDFVAGKESRQLGGVRRGQGKILNLDGRKVAAYRDKHGAVTLCSPVCTHLKCIVAWNPAEQTWDCPCHGSRFKPTGEVISGPAEEPLEKISDSAGLH